MRRKRGRHHLRENVVPFEELWAKHYEENAPIDRHFETRTRMTDIAAMSSSARRVDPVSGRREPPPDATDGPPTEPIHR